MITHEDTDLRVGRSPAQSLSVNTVRVEHALFCTCSFSPRSCVPRRYRRRRFDAKMSDVEGHARDLARRFVAKALSGLRDVTRRDVVSGQTERNSVRVAEDVHRVERLSHKIVQVHQ